MSVDGERERWRELSVMRKEERGREEEEGGSLWRSSLIYNRRVPVGIPDPVRPRSMRQLRVLELVEPHGPHGFEPSWQPQQIVGKWAAVTRVVTAATRQLPPLLPRCAVKGLSRRENRRGNRYQWLPRAPPLKHVIRAIDTWRPQITSRLLPVFKYQRRHPAMTETSRRRKFMLSACRKGEILPRSEHLSSDIRGSG